MAAMHRDGGLMGYELKLKRGFPYLPTNDYSRYNVPSRNETRSPKNQIKKHHAHQSNHRSQVKAEGGSQLNKESATRQ